MSAADSYSQFLRRKLSVVPRTGIAGEIASDGSLFDHQRALTNWALRRGSAAIFADTGLGKMRMELAWADVVHKHTRMPVMIHTPLAVAPQLAAEAALMGIDAKVCRSSADLIDGINITNYDRLHLFDPKVFGGVALDESGCIKHHNTRTFMDLTEAYRETPFKLPASATPAPNDWTELGTHAEFLGICTRAEMLAEFFCHDGAETQVWRLKGHARSLFWKWVATWGAMVRRPSDLGFSDDGYILPPLNMHEHIVNFEMVTEGQLFATDAQTMSDRRKARKLSMDLRVQACAAQVNAEPNEPWVVWCDLNAEGDALAAAIDGAIQVAGSDDIDTKESRLMDFAQGRARVLVSKPSICGWGLNWQHSARMAFVGVTDSYETVYQAIRREWRFGQKRPVDVHVFASKAEGAVVANIRRKEAAAQEMAEQLSAETRDAVMAEVVGLNRETNNYSAGRLIAVPAWLRSEAA